MTRNQDIRSEVLIQLYGVRPLKASANFLAKQARKSGNDFGEVEVKAECEFLLGQELVESLESPVTGEVKYSITSKGVLAYENQ